MDLRLVSAPLSQEQKLTVVTLDEVKAQARITQNDEDSLIRDDIEAAYDYFAGPEGWLNHCCLLSEQWEWYTAAPTNSRIFELPMRPALGATLTGFDWLQADDSYAVVGTGIFHVLPSQESFAFISRAGWQAWPYLGVPHPRAYRIRFTAGFGTDKADIPSGIRKAIKLLACHWAANREATSTEGRKPGEKILYGIEALAGRYRISPDHS